MNINLTASLKHLAKLQKVDGSFHSLSSPNPTSFSPALTFPSLFSSTLILICLSQLKNQENSQLQKIKDKLATFILSQKSADWSFNYWIKDSNEYKTLPYPDDLDDTFCALSALFLYNPSLITGKVMAKVVSQLTTLEVKEGGPYRTWLVPKNAKKEWRDIDLAVNANIAYFLSLQEITLPNLDRLFDQAIKQNKLSSPYYPENLVIIYFLSRFYTGKYQTELKNIILKKKKVGHWENPLNEALSVLSLMHLGEPTESFKKNIEYIQSKQKNGLWKAYPFYTGVNPKRNQFFYGGSEALTTAFCLLAIDTYQAKMVKPTLFDKQKEKLFQQIVQQVKRETTSLQQPLKDAFLKNLQAIADWDNSHEIVLLPFLFAYAIKKRVSNKLLIDLGKANLYGWIAYTIYDNFYDNEGEVSFLAAANLSLRRLSAIFTQTSLKNPEFLGEFYEVMDKLDNANAWEVKYCREKIIRQTSELIEKLPHFPGLNFYADRSMGHALGPLAILFSLGFKKNDKEIQAVKDFFRHYLIARQLNDDAHDFEKDLKMGHLNAVGVWVLHELKGRSGTITLDKLQSVFWYKVILKVCRQITDHLNLAKSSLEDSTIIVNKEPFYNILQRYELVVKQVLAERERTLEFLEAY